VSLALSAVVGLAQDFLRERLPLPGAAVEAANQVLGLLILAGLIALIYKILPDAKVEWPDVALGAVTTAALLSLGKWLIGLYLGRAAVVSPYGAAGSLVVILLWVYYVSWILLFGAELTRAHARLYGSAPVEPSPGAMTVATPKEGI
jgi:membrane protein